MGILSAGVSFAQTSGGTAQQPALATDPQSTAQTRCDNRCKNNSDYDKCFDDCMDAAARANRRWSGGDQCEQLRTTEYKAIIDEIAEACGEIGVSRGSTPSDTVFRTCAREIESISSCMNRYRGNSRSNIYTDATSARDNCGWMAVKGKDSAEKRESRYRTAVEKTEDEIKEAEDKYFETEEKMLTTGAEIQEQLEAAREEAESANRELQTELTLIQEKEQIDTQKAKDALEQAMGGIQSMQQIGNEFVNADFTATARSLELKCQAEAQKIIDALKQRREGLIAQKKYKLSVRDLFDTS
ncbi:MAG TPA: hypothetical protein VFV50_10750, partial [Bdellovibrionales bacterium]|nr:hypothetical protein [Bdellovibrionales bacterium]